MRMPANRERWDARLEAFQTFVRMNGRIPSKGSDDATERSLWTWMRNQRVSYRGAGGTALDTEQKAQLASIPGFIPDEKQRSWTESFCLVEAYFEKFGRGPQMSSQEPDVKKLAHWLNRQIRRMFSYASAQQYGSLTEEQVAALQTLPGIAERAAAQPRHSWDTNCEAVKRFVEQYGRTPLASSSDTEERRLSGWLSKQRSRYQQLAPSAKPLSAERRERLEAVPGFVTERANGRLNSVQS